MTIYKLERVLWLIQKRFPNEKKITNNELRKAIMIECGTDPLTYRNNRKALIILGWIKTYKKKHILITNKHITG